MANTKITIIFDNEASEGYESGWAFSAMIEKDDKKILFDTGYDGTALLKNLEKAGFDPEEITEIVISHKHWDHAGGLQTVLYKTKKPLVILPSTFSSNLKAQITKFGDLREATLDQNVEITKDIRTTNALPTSMADLTEISLMIDTPKGLVVVCGCSHPGIPQIVEHCKQFGEIYAILGGFHGFKRFEVLSDAKLIIPCHCTQHKKKILDKYPKNAEACYSGLTIEI
jgi:7,8-dihydropterin-6-yl-methyl-4-(beta-D-ribofuranosyl)aminobenzene 5'-phosphate synthase